ncbi:Uncharacterised protein [Vibrio cholerae]|nr:Uncharacterised protein [Vibrio cholerae]
MIHKRLLKRRRLMIRVLPSSMALSRALPNTHSVMIWWVKSMVCCSISAFLHRSWMMPSAVLVL